MSLATDHPADPRQPAPDRHAHFPCFDGLRAIAAVSVLLHHVAFDLGWAQNKRFGEALAHCDAGVSIFFVISGFLLYRPFVAVHLDGRPALSFRRFMRRRLLRIVPAFWAALVLIWLLFGYEHGTLAGPRDVVIYFGFLQTFDAARFFGGVNQAWSLGTEMCFYLFLPFYAWGIRRIAARRPEQRVQVEIAGLVVLYLASVCFRAAMFAADDYWRTPAVPRPSPSYAFLATSYWLPSYLDVFALGMGLAVSSAWSDRAGRLPALAAAAARRPLLMWTFAALAYLVVSFGASLPRNLIAVLDVRQSFTRQLLYGVMAFFLVVPAALGPTREGLPRRFLLARPVAFAGLVSYGIYLWHQVWVQQVSDWLGYSLYPPDGSVVVASPGRFIAILAGSLCLSVLTAALSYYVLERPLLRLKDGPTGAPTNATPPGRPPDSPRSRAA